MGQAEGRPTADSLSLVSASSRTTDTLWDLEGGTLCRPRQGRSLSSLPFLSYLSECVISGGAVEVAEAYKPADGWPISPVLSAMHVCITPGDIVLSFVREVRLRSCCVCSRS